MTELEPESSRAAAASSAASSRQWLALGVTVYLSTFSAAIYQIFLGSFLSRRGLDREAVGIIGAAGSAAMMTGNLVWATFRILGGSAAL